MPELLTELYLAMKRDDDFEIDRAFRHLERCGMDKHTAITLLNDKDTQLEIIKELRRRKEKETA